MEFNVLDIGLCDYLSAWHIQRKLVNEIKAGENISTLVLCRHYPVITCGRKAEKNNILTTQGFLEDRGIKIYGVDRGGDITYHGPGQIVLYPVFDLHCFKKDIHFFLRSLEGAVLELLKCFGIQATRRSGLTGVWIKQAKIASIGIAIKNWVSSHGVSINVKKEDMDNYHFIRPCGMDIEMITMEDAAGRDIEMERAKEAAVDAFKEVFEAQKIMCNL